MGRVGGIRKMGPRVSGAVMGKRRSGEAGRGRQIGGLRMRDGGGHDFCMAREAEREMGRGRRREVERG